MPTGEDLDFEAFHPFLRTKAKKSDDKIGWETSYIFIPKKDLIMSLYFLSGSLRNLMK